MINPNQINLNGWEFTYTERGDWISKAVPFSKSKSILPEQPHYKIVNELEERYEKKMERCLAEGLKDIVKYLNVH